MIMTTIERECPDCGRDLEGIGDGMRACCCSHVRIVDTASGVERRLGRARRGRLIRDLITATRPSARPCR